MCELKAVMLQQIWPFATHDSLNQAPSGRKSGIFKKDRSKSFVEGHADRPRRQAWSNAERFVFCSCCNAGTSMLSGNARIHHAPYACLCCVDHLTSLEWLAVAVSPVTISQSMIPGAEANCLVFPHSCATAAESSQWCNVNLILGSQNNVENWVSNLFQQAGAMIPDESQLKTWKIRSPKL